VVVFAAAPELRGAPSVAVLVVARALQAVAAALIVPAWLAVQKLWVSGG
jgi:hypothetical protein